jgi:biopolymer transport protein ExbD
LFFLIVSTLVNPNVIKLLLPNSKQSMTMNKQEVYPVHHGDHQYFINKEPVPEADLKGALLDATKNLQQPTIVLRLDQALSVQDLVNVLQIGTEIKVKMILATKNATS